MKRRRFGWVIALMLASCSAVFDLQPASNGDGDGDHVSDLTDNCPTTYNPDQSDLDHDGIGDACDACDAPSEVDVDMDGIPDGCDGCIGDGIDGDHNGVSDNCELCIGVGADSDGDGVADNCDRCAGFGEHDEDGDGIPDGCDDCPQTANADQADGDGDGVGNACDPEADASRLQFDAFTAQDPAWYVYGMGWVFANDAYEVVVATPVATRSLGAPSATFSVSTTVSIPATNGGGLVAAFVEDTEVPVDGSERRRMACAVSNTGGLTVVTPGASAPAATRIDHTELPFELLLVYDQLTNVVTCTGRRAGGGATSVEATGTAPVRGWRAGIGASHTTARFERYAVIGPKI